MHDYFAIKTLASCQKQHNGASNTVVSLLNSLIHTMLQNLRCIRIPSSKPPKLVSTFHLTY